VGRLHLYRPLSLATRRPVVIVELQKRPGVLSRLWAPNSTLPHLGMELVVVTWAIYNIAIQLPTKRFFFDRAPLGAKKVCACRSMAMLQLRDQKLARKLGK
jgi:hypothetical protein